MQIPFRSRSDSGAVNAFCRQTVEDLEKVFAAQRQLSAELAELEDILYLQSLAISSRVAELEAALVSPQPAGDWWVQRLPAVVFTADANGEISKVYRQGVLRADRSTSRLLVKTIDGQELVPAALSVQVTPPLPPGGMENDPLNAIRGSLPWRRRIGAAFTASVTYEVAIPVDVLDRPVFNQIEIIPYPLYGVDIEQVTIVGGGVLSALLSTPVQGPIRLHITPMQADAVQIALRQAQPFLLNQEHCYCLGLSRVAISEALAGPQEALFTARVQLAGQGPWRLTDCSVYPALPGRQEVSLKAGEETFPVASLPVTVNAGEIEVLVRLTAVQGCGRPYFERVELIYQAS